MFESFSPRYEGVLRGLFIVWACLWTTVNVLQLLFQYASYNFNSATDSDLARWWFQTLAVLIGSTLGVTLLFLVANFPASIKKRKPIKNLGLYSGLTVVYFLFDNVVKIFIAAFFEASNFTRQFIFISAWLLPSIIIMVFMILYYLNLGKYNEELEAPKPQ